MAVLQITWAIFTIILFLAGAPALARAADPSTDASEAEFFERHVRPLLLNRCGSCHVEDEAGGLSLSSRTSLLEGGDSGPAIEPGNIRNSRIVSAIRREADAPMPPDHPLSDAEIRIIEHWIERGAAWPDDQPIDVATPPAAERQATDHWAFQPVGRPTIPEAGSSSWPRRAIDAFILRRQQDAGLSPAPPADRRSLVRRATYALTGVPPTMEEVEAFVDSDDPQAYPRLIERLLQTPQYGQHQARMWLDLARYSDTKGYVYAREERFWVHAWNYRDWVVRALNQDMPYDRFLLLQIAADQVPDRQPSDLAALGFLTLGRRFLGVKHDIIDDRIDVLCRGTMALTVSCARCHDHKYDPIPTADYYSLYGVFDSCSEKLVPLPGARAVVEDPQSEVRTKLDRLNETLQQKRAEQAARVRDRIGDYLWAQTELHKYPPAGFDQIFSKDDLLPAFVRRFQRYLAATERQQNAVFNAWRCYRTIAPDEFAAEAPRVTKALHAGEYGEVNRHVLEAFETPPDSLRNVADRYAELLRVIDEQWQTQCAAASDGQQAMPQRMEDPASEQLRQVLYGSDSPCTVPDRGIVHSESYFDSATTTELWKLQGELDRAILAAGESAPFAVTLVDNPRPTEPHVFRRGNPLDQAEQVSRHFLSVLAGEEPERFTQGSGRLELARRITDPSNPLTARVIVNRVWAQHFGSGLVTTPSDFGTRAAPPSHPELLDFLARRLVERGWSLKALHREILLSACYRQNAYGPRDEEAWSRANTVDPENRLLWHQNPHRLTFEELRDSVLAATGRLDSRVGGKATPILEAPFSSRRTLYGLVDRQFLPSSFRIFDFANPDLHIPQRNETTIPQQALFMMNHPFVVHQASQLVEDLEDEPDPAHAVDTLFQRILQRLPSELERSEALTVLASRADADATSPAPTTKDWRYGFGAIDEDSQRVVNFTPLPHFSGDAWQGGANYPDPQLGWVQLTATGGHPGNDLQHASIRRWVAPRSMMIKIQSALKHEPSAGDGIRGFIVSSHDGILRHADVHQQSATMDVDELQVAAGETIDFVVDINEVLNSDQYLWTIQIEALDENQKQPGRWNSASDFSPRTTERLSPLGQLAQAILCTNEFMFID